MALQGDYRVLFSDVLEANGFVLLPSDVRHYETLITLPRYHGDPFDRLIIAQAQVEELAIITCDEDFSAYKVPLIW